MSSSHSSPPPPRLLVAATQADVAPVLNTAIALFAKTAIQDRGMFTIALSGGSLPKFLADLPEAFAKAGVDPQWDCWHVLLADERCVPLESKDSNLGAIQQEFLKHTSIPSSQVYGIDQALVQNSNAEAIARDYETKFLQVLAGKNDPTDKTTLLLDLAVLGFGPDGHTCSLFPDHPLLEEINKWVASIEDSPKPPPKRITLTFPVLNSNTRNVIFCGAGSSKQEVVEKIFVSTSQKISQDRHVTEYQAEMASPPPYPCAMVKPLESLTWIIDADAMGTSE
jgi:6-phosphogluconolactonase